MLTPGALTSGLIEPSHGDGPRALKNATSSKKSVAPVANDSGSLPGLRTLPSSGPSLPAANAGKIPAARRACTSAWNSGMQPGTLKPHELLTTSGALAGSLHAFAAIQRAPGATPMLDPDASPPTAVPVVWVPCPLGSNGLACSP